jgi:hypothetical protein
MDLEERAVPGSVLTRPDLAAALGSTLALALDSTGTDAIAIASYEAELTSQLGGNAVVDVGDQSAVQAPVRNPVDGQALEGVSVLPTGDLNGDNNQGLPPPPAHRQYVNLYFLSGSFLKLGNQSPITFGDDSLTEGWTHVSLNPQDKLVGSAKHFNLPPYHAMALNYNFFVQLEAQSKLQGRYDPTTGNSTTSITLDVYITSPDAPMFNNQTCKVPPATLNFTTDNGTPFAMNPDGTADVGTSVDNTFAAPAIPMGVCGNVGFVDYATVINNFFGLPSPAGANTFSLHVAITPPPGP